MRRVVVGVLVLLLALVGCSQVLGTADWDKVEVTFTPPEDAASPTSAAYTLVVSPTEATYTVAGDETTQPLPEGAWAALTTGVRAFGDRKAVACAGKGAITIKVSAGGKPRQDFEANGCDAGNAFKQATDLMAQIIAQIK